MLKYLRVIIMLLLVGMATRVSADNQGVRYITPETGLNNGAINDIVQDRDGFIWMATWDGITRYDGISFKTYKPDVVNEKSIQARQVIRLFVDAHGNLWAVTYAGVSRYNRYSDNFDRVAMEGTGFNYDVPNQSTNMVEAGGFLYFQNLNSIYVLSNSESSAEPVFNQVVLDEVLSLGNFSIFQGHDELLITKRLPGQNRSDIYAAEASVEQGAQVLKLSLRISLEGSVEELLPLEHNRFIIRKSTEIGQCNPEGSTWTYETLIDDLSAQNLLLTSTNVLWLVKNPGLESLDLHTGLRQLYDFTDEHQNLLLGNQISSLFEDFSGNLWIGHSGAGVSIVALSPKSFVSFRHNPEDLHSLSGNTVMCFGECTDGLLVSTDYNGLNFLRQDPATGVREFSKIEFPSEFTYSFDFQSIWNIAREGENKYWFASNFGLIESTRQGKNWKHVQHIIRNNEGMRLRRILLDDSNNLWLGTYNGLFLLPRNQRDSMNLFSYLPDPENPGALSSLVITDILLDSKNRMWLGTRDGGINLLMDDYSTLNMTSSTAPVLEFRKYRAGSGPGFLNNNEINCLYESYDGRIWAGTQGGGVNILNPESGEVEYITTNEGLPGNNVFGILSDEQGNLWLSTNKGICAISYYESERKISNYGPSDGIQGNVFMINAYFKDSRDMLYFGGRNGFTRFLPSQIAPNRIPPRIVLTDLQIFGEEIQTGDLRHKREILSRVLNETDTLVLSHKDYNVRIGVAAIHFQNPEENSVEYMLEGFNKRWIRLPKGENSISFANLDPGKYILNIKAYNSDNIPSPDVRRLQLIILPPWYKTWYGYLLFSLLTIAAILFLFQLILRQQILRHKIKLDSEQIENIKELNESKIRFFTNISHELRTPLNLVLSPIEYLYKHKDTSPNIKEQLSMSLRNAKLLKRLINNIIEFRKHEAGKAQLKLQRINIADFVLQVGKNFEILQPNMGIQMAYHVPDDVILADFDPSKIEHVLYNLLSNAFKHTDKGGTILITLENHFAKGFPRKDQKEEIVLTVFNEGKIIAPENLEKIFLRFYMGAAQGEGSGIGLSLAKSLVEMHMGSIEVKNIDSSGVEFKICMPRFNAATSLVKDSHVEHVLEDESYISRAMSVVKGAQAPASRKDPGSSDPASTDPEQKVLVIEDNSDLRTFYRTLLSDSFQFHEAENGKEGLEMADEIIPDLIICDVLMPVMDGIDVCKSIKGKLQTSHIPIILLTAKNAPEQIVSGYDAGADAYVVKPFETEVLISQIEALLQNRERIREKYTASGIYIELATSQPGSKDDYFMKTLNEELEGNLFNEDYNVVSLSKMLNISRNHLYRKVKALTGYSTVEYIRVYKLNKAAELLKTQKYSIKEVCFKTGFKDQSYFTKSFKNHFNQNPTEFIRSYSQAQ